VLVRHRRVPTLPSLPDSLRGRGGYVGLRPTSSCGIPDFEHTRHTSLEGTGPKAWRGASHFVLVLLHATLSDPTPRGLGVKRNGCLPMITHRYYSHTQTIWMAVMDACCMVAGIVLGVVIRIGTDSLGEYISGHHNGWAFLCGSMILANYLMGNYGIQVIFSRFNLFVSGVFSLGAGLLVLSVTSYAWFQQLVGRGVLAWAAVVYAGLWFLLRLVVYEVLYRSRFFLCRAAILGTGRTAQRMRETIENKIVFPVHRAVAYIRLAGFDSGVDLPAGQILDGRVVIDSTAEALPELVRSLGVSTVIIGFEDQEEVVRIYGELRQLRFEGMEILTALGASEMYSARVPIDQLSEAWVMQAAIDSAAPAVRRLKRAFDVALALALGLVFLPVALAVALLIKLSAPRNPVIYRQRRLGQFGQEFTIYKFRSMTEGAEEESGPVWAASEDVRITRIGRVLRKFRFDEVPQFWNVIKGDMSFVGPRPERPEIIDQLEKQIPFYRERLNVMPGLTGWAQIRYPYGSTVEHAVKKLEFDLYYMKHLSLRLDLQIILSTIRIVLFGLERRVSAEAEPQVAC